MDLDEYFAGSGEKRELSDSSTNRNDPKKTAGGSLNDSQNEYIFAERLSSPHCVVILVNCGEAECVETDCWNL